MKKRILISSLVILISSFIHAQNAPGFAVVELYTSEGCFNCPDAEDYMDNLINKAKKESLPIYVLEFHVDYWNYAGWKDTFALRGNTLRQDEYKVAMKLKSLYTPQVVVDGKAEYVGGDESSYNIRVHNDLLKPAKVSLTCTATRMGDKKIKINYTLNGDASGCNLNIALVQSGLNIKVGGGENKNKTLHHNNVVRVFKSISPKQGTNEYVLDVPYIPANSKLILFVQAKDLSMLGAAQASIQ
jgi:hypothetical protein